jgi:hypothetical protein
MKVLDISEIDQLLDAESIESFPYNKISAKLSKNHFAFCILPGPREFQNLSPGLTGSSAQWMQCGCFLLLMVMTGWPRGHLCGRKAIEYTLHFL